MNVYIHSLSLTHTHIHTSHCPSSPHWNSALSEPFSVALNSITIATQIIWERSHTLPYIYKPLCLFIII